MKTPLPRAKPAVKAGTILVIEDEKDLVRLIQRKLEQDGYQGRLRRQRRVGPQARSRGRARADPPRHRTSRDGRPHLPSPAPQSEPRPGHPAVRPRDRRGPHPRPEGRGRRLRRQAVFLGRTRRAHRMPSCGAAHRERLERTALEPKPAPLRRETSSRGPRGPCGRDPGAARTSPRRAPLPSPGWIRTRGASSDRRRRRTG